MSTDRSEAAADLEVEGLALRSIGLDEIRVLWHRHFGAVPACQSAELLRRRLAYQFQARQFGPLRPELQRRIRKLHEAFRLEPNCGAELRHSVQPGTVLTRNWKGVLHKVKVCDSGFEYQGRRYDSLSQIARLITGSSRSGPVFFGLRSSKP